MNRLSQDKIDALFDCFRASMGVRATARATGVVRNTVAKYLQLFEADAANEQVLCLCGKPRHRGWCHAQEQASRTEANCECGKPLRHRGWCRVRYARSPGRQAFMRRWHAPKAPVDAPQLPIVASAPSIVAPPEPARPVEHIPVPTFTAEEKKALQTRRYHMQRRGRAAKSSIEDLRALVAASNAPIQRLPAGAHTGWKPSWMGE